ncbi:hypothetical protein MPR_2965 [Myroides profundi]|nr:hypothetical protein MPR_2965 [Myroides profundi]
MQIFKGDVFNKHPLFYIFHTKEVHTLTMQKKELSFNFINNAK